MITDMTTEENKPINLKAAILHLLAAAFFFSLMTFFVRVSGELPTMQKAFFRNFFALLIATASLIRTGTGFYVRKGNGVSLLMRCLFGTSGLIANFWAIDRLGIADANMLNKLSPFFAILMSIFILQEKPNRIEWISVILAFIGAAFVAKPGAGLASFPALIGIIGGFAAGTAYTFVRKLGLSGERGPVIVMYFSLFSTVVLLPGLIMDYHPMTVRQLLFLLLAGASAAGGQLSVTAAYQHAPARDISVFDYSQIVYAALFGFFLFGELPDKWSFLGYAIIIGTSFAKWYLVTKRKT